jgi:hypothetical protein
MSAAPLSASTASPEPAGPAAAPPAPSDAAVVPVAATTPDAPAPRRGFAGFDDALASAAAALGLASVSLLLPPPDETLIGWKPLLDLFLSVGIVAFVAVLVLLWTGRTAVVLFLGRAAPSADTVAEAGAPRAGETGENRRRVALAWAAALLLVCTVELLSHAGERNGFLATSRPASGVETWTVADGYATLLDGIPAQGDGLHLLGLLGMFLGDRPPSPSEFDRRAGHVFLVSLLFRPLGTYWSFAAVNLLCWWGAALAVWWLGRRRWPGTAVPWIASLLTATGHGFIFMGAAPQAHAPAFAAFAGLLALCDRLDLWSPRTRLAAWAKAGWATGAAGLVYLVHIPALSFVWLYGMAGVDRRSVRRTAAGLVLASAVALALVAAWEAYASRLLGLRFEGGNNDLAGVALAGWVRLAREGPVYVIGQFHASSIRGLLGGAFYYPWWALAALGLVACTPAQRRWSLAVFVTATLPAIAFTTRFNLPRVAYFAYPAVYLLAARGIEVLAGATARLARRRPDARTVPALQPRGVRAAPVWMVAVAVPLVVLAVLANVDLFGIQQLNLWFHYSQGTGW